METTKLPILKLADNVPCKVTLETQPEQAKELPNKFDETKPQHTYFVTATDPFTNVTSKHVWFATDRQHREILSKGAMLGDSFEIVNQKMPGDKYASFIIRGLSKDTTELPDFGGDPLPEEPPFPLEADTLLGVEPRTPINAVKRSKTDPVAMGMALKKAVDICLFRGDIEPGVLKETAWMVYDTYQELMSE